MDRYRATIAACLCSLLLFATSAHALLIGPTGGAGLDGEYASAADSPFAGMSFSDFYLDNFEDHLLNVAGVSASSGGPTSVVFGPSIHDSVDTDDGVLDGSGLAGDSYFSAGLPGIVFTFDATVLGALPTHAGLVWTDGSGTIVFEAFDRFGISLGSIVANLENGSFNGETSEDRFFGVVDAGGISAIKISNSTGGIEIDHLQYGLAAAVPEPQTWALLFLGLAGMLWRTRAGVGRAR